MYVALHAGAWIETGLETYIFSGLMVALHAGAWIETEPIPANGDNTMCRPPCGGVD